RFVDTSPRVIERTDNRSTRKARRVPRTQTKFKPGADLVGRHSSQNMRLIHIKQAILTCPRITALALHDRIRDPAEVGAPRPLLSDHELGADGATPAILDQSLTDGGIR